MKLSRKILIINVNKIKGNIFKVFIIAFFKLSLANIIINRFSTKHSKMKIWFGKKNIVVAYIIKIKNLRTSFI